MLKHLKNPTARGWALFFIGYIVLLAVERHLSGEITEGAFMAAVYALLLPSLYLLYKGTAGKGRPGFRVLIVITHFWLGYALAALLWLIVT